MKSKKYYLGLAIMVGLFFTPLLAFAGFETSIGQLTMILSKVVLPVMAVISLLFAGFSFMTQNQNCKQHLLYAVIGILIAAGASMFFNFLTGAIR